MDLSVSSVHSSFDCVVAYVVDKTAEVLVFPALTGAEEGRSAQGFSPTSTTAERNGIVSGTGVVCHAPVGE